MTTTPQTRVGAIRQQMANIRTQLKTTTTSTDRLALEEDYEDLRQDLIEALHY